MNRCPSCKGELVEGSVICPHCGEILDTKNPLADLDNELERFSQMIFNMENNIDLESYVPKYDPNDIEKILSGESRIEEETPEEKTEEAKVEEAKAVEEPIQEAKSFSFTPSSFKASGSGVVKLDEDSSKEVKIEDVSTDKKDDETTDATEKVSESVKEESAIEEAPVETVSPEDQEILNALHSFSDYIDETLADEETLNKLFEEISSYCGQFESEEDAVESIDFDEVDDLDQFTNKGSRQTENNVFTSINSLDAFLQKENSVENIDKKVLDFLEEIKHAKGNEKHVDNAKETYLKLNFVTTDKFATLISSENERIDTQTVASTSGDEKARITDIFGLEAIINAETLSEDELNATIDAVNVQKDEIMHSLEMEEKELIVIQYKNLRMKMISYLKVGMIILMIITSLHFTNSIFDYKFLSVESKLYSAVSIEKYDQYIYGSVLDMTNQTKFVNENFEKYKSGQLSKSEMIDICNQSIEVLEKYKLVFEKHVYDEASDYVFAANKGFFFAAYHIENIKTYVETEDEYYLKLNVLGSGQKEQILKVIDESRVTFLKELGYTDEEIQILNYKANAEVGK